ncbi:hypothetical protein CSA37_10500 [Candidatus Fermentibacteria bacterium]|nr:MAG: hypothetical protein CSA37_10500 [Candidatus Fermentibacteria bacterium]
MKILYLLPLLAFTLLAEPSEYTLPGVESDVVNIQVNVWGEVRNPGRHFIPWNSDLRDALSAAGGPVSTADLSCIRIVSNDLEIKYDLKAFLHGDGLPVPVMEPGVTVYVGVSSYEWWKDIVDFSYKVLIMVNVVWVMSR